MNSLLALLAALLMQPAGKPPELQDVIAAWTERATSFESAEIELAIQRDSRSRGFGVSDFESSPATIRLRFTPERTEIHVPRLTVVRRDGRTRAAESDPERARVEFRNVLLEDQLKGPQMVPIIEPATRIIQANGREAGQSLSPLDRLLAEAPLWSARPLARLDQSRLALETDGVQAGLARLVEQQGDGRELGMWIESAPPYRPMRIVLHVEERPVWQLDFTWSVQEPRVATGYCAQTINNSGEPLEFVDAKVVRVETPLPASSAIANVASHRDQAPPPDLTAVRLRTLGRQALDSLALPIGAFAVSALVILRRSRRRPAVS